MGRERQKAKSRSSIRPVKQKPKKTKKPLLANPLIAEHWDRSQTLSQNYARLGLRSKLNKASGGREVLGSNIRISKDGEVGGQKDWSGVRAEKPRIRVGEARIVRDERTGAIVSVLEGEGVERVVEEEKGPYRRLEDPLVKVDGLVVDVDDEVGNGEDAEGNIVKSLEREAALPSAPKRRKQSDREKVFLQKLIEKHGSDEEKGCYQKMARDTELNVMQQSAGDLRKRVRKYLGIKSGG